MRLFHEKELNPFLLMVIVENEDIQVLSKLMIVSLYDDDLLAMILNVGK